MEQLQHRSRESLSSPDNAYSWPDWDESWGKPPIIHVHLERPKSRPADNAHFQEELQNIANAAKQTKAVALREQLQYWAGKDIYFSLGEGNKALPPYEVSSVITEYSIKPPLMRHNPNAWYRYPTENAKKIDSEISFSVSNPVTEDLDPGFVKRTFTPSAIASPEQNLLLVLAAGREFNQFYELRMKATEKNSQLTPEQKQGSVRQSLEHAQLAKDNSNKVSVVNSSMQSAVPAYSPMDKNYFEAASRLQFQENGLPILNNKSEVDFSFERREFGIASQLHPQITNNPELQQRFEFEGINLPKQLINMPLIELRGKDLSRVDSLLTPKQQFGIVKIHIDLSDFPESSKAYMLKVAENSLSEAETHVVDKQDLLEAAV